jgi:hypothetical protein
VAIPNARTFDGGSRFWLWHQFGDGEGQTFGVKHANMPIADANASANVGQVITPQMMASTPLGGLLCYAKLSGAAANG